MDSRSSVQKHRTPLIISPHQWIVRLHGFSSNLTPDPSNLTQTPHISPCFLSNKVHQQWKKVIWRLRSQGLATKTSNEAKPAMEGQTFFFSLSFHLCYPTAWQKQGRWCGVRTQRHVSCRFHAAKGGTPFPAAGRGIL